MPEQPPFSLNPEHELLAECFPHLPPTASLSEDEQRLIIEGSQPIRLAEQPPLLSADLNIPVLGKTWEELREGPSKRHTLRENATQIIARHPIPSVCVALFRPGTSGADVLLHLRADNHLWGLPGGAVEYEESVEQAVRREMAEETGLNGFEVRGIVSVHSAPATGAVFSYPDGNTVHYVCLTVLAWIADWEASVTHLRASEESLALYWFPWETCQASLPEPFAPVHRQRLETAWAVLQGQAVGLECC